ncbi:MAG TPA: TetR/AcrR family transcriptional regulator [Baekduia sp.]|uniref:TetR/AcrR family transcriptional regulator n=1 Tax=Baekduia sp. TaxID=2600305 RepID=UPI002D78E84C|nr:TetR/AcrR family transcriptional regulator [Baekduia sp.]HET6509708.1 TetR/AcrR family transcriptional regulator [Baekduia sp.]
MSTEERIREVATRLFYERGYHATSMRDIAGGVGVKAGSLYNHFPGKQDILFRICFDTAQALADGLTGRMPAGAGPEQRLRALVRWHVEFHAKHRHAARVADDQLHALTEPNRRTVLEVRDAYEAVLLSLLEEGEAAGAWAMGDRRVVGFGIATMCTGVDVWFKPGGALSPERIGEIYADFVVGGLRAGS